MKGYNLKLIYGSYTGMEKNAVEMINRELSGIISYPLPVVQADKVTKGNLYGQHLILVGTAKSNSLLRTLADEGVYQCPAEAEGYCIKITKSVFDDSKQMIIIAGADETGALYGAVDFAAYYIPYAENHHEDMQYNGHYTNKIFITEDLPEYEKVSAPAIKQRGIWTWGHVIYDYKKYIRNMARLKMNTLILWNDYVPVNIRDVIEEAHAYGVKIYLGYSWGWNEARPKNGGLDISDHAALQRISDRIVEDYRREYIKLPIDGIYFQSFTETNDSESNHIVIAERAVQFVNETAERIFALNPDLLLMFGLHATSVSEKLEYIKQTDARIMIVWEDCGAFPYAYTPNKVEGFKETCELSEKIATLRGAEERFGIVSKGLTCLDWSTFEHQQGEFVMGLQSEQFINRRTEEKKELWKYVNAYWVKNAQYAYDVVKLLIEKNSNTLVTALLEDGMFEKQIYLAAALYGEMLWDTDSSMEELLCKVALRKDVVC